MIGQDHVPARYADILDQISLLAHSHAQRKWERIFRVPENLADMLIAQLAPGAAGQTYSVAARRVSARRCSGDATLDLLEDQHITRSES